MSYRKTKLILPPKGKPLDRRDLILKQVNIEEAMEPSFTYQTPLKNDSGAFKRQSRVPLSVGIINLVRQFRP